MFFCERIFSHGTLASRRFKIFWIISGYQRPLYGSERGSAFRLPGPQWRGQDHDDAHDPRPLPSRLRPDYLEWHTRARGRSSLLRLFARRTWALSQDGGRGTIALPGTPLWSLQTGRSESTR